MGTDLFFTLFFIYSPPYGAATSAKNDKGVRHSGASYPDSVSGLLGYDVNVRRGWRSTHCHTTKIRHRYGSDDPGILTCIELATGEDQWQERTPGKCSLIYFAGGLMITRSEKGKVCLVRVSPEKCEVLGEFEQPDRSDKPSWPHPVVADGMLYLRDQDALLVYDVRAK